MADSREKPELETLDYKPKIAELEKAIGSGNVLDILPNGQVRKKVHLAEQPPNNCDCLERPKIYTIECVSKHEQPNKNLMIFEQVDGCIKTALELLEQIEVDTTDQRGDKQGCIWTLEGWYKHNLKHLRKAFE